MLGGVKLQVALCFGGGNGKAAEVLRLFGL